MNKFQNLSFRDVEEFMDYLPDHEKQIVQRLRGIILNCMPQGKEKLAYNVPFYYLHKRVCYIWPSSIPWGGIKDEKSVVLGFCKGNLLTDDAGILNKEGRKEIATLTFNNTRDIHADLIRSYIYEALVIDEQAAE